MRNQLVYIGLLFFVWSSCKKDQFETFDRTKDSDYFIDSIGAYSIFKVSEIIFDDFANKSDTLEYQIKEHNESHFTDNLGRKAIRIDRYKRLSDTSAWKYLNTWYAVKASDMVERVEDNKRLVKLSFPVTTDAVWNSNAYNMDVAVNVFYGLINQRYTLDTFRFRNALSVESTNVKDSFKERSFREVYAKGIGLVYKNHVSIVKNASVLRGFKLNYQLLRHVKK